MNNELGTITINGEEYVVKYSIRALFLWESARQKPFELTTLFDQYFMLYCMIISANKDKVELLDFDVFINALDEDPNLFQSLMDVFTKAQEREQAFAPDNDKKKATRKRKK